MFIFHLFIFSFNFYRVYKWRKFFYNLYVSLADHDQCLNKCWQVLWVMNLSSILSPFFITSNFE